MSDDHVFAVEQNEGTTDARFALLDSEMRLLGEVIHNIENFAEAYFSPDGTTVALVVDRAVVYLVDVQSMSPGVLLETVERAGWEQVVVLIEGAYRGPGLLVQRIYWRETDGSDGAWPREYSYENRYFMWSGDPLPGREEPFFFFELPGRTLPGWTLCGVASRRGGGEFL